MTRSLTLLLVLLPLAASAQTSAPKTPPKTPSKTAPQLEVHFLPLKEHGESILIKTPAGKRLLIDAGLPTAGPEVVEYLQEQGVRKIDLLILSHDDPDHAGGLFDVFRCFPITEWWDGPRPETNSLHRSLQSLAKTRKIKRTVVERGHRRQLEPGLLLEVLAPSTPLFTTLGRAASNPNSVVVRLTWKKTRFLFTGDIYVSIEKRLLANESDPTCHLLKVAHHGSTTSSSLPFLQATKAKAAVICCDESLGFPRPKVLRHLKTAQIDWYRTDRNGAVVVRSQGVPAGDLTITVARNAKNDAKRNLLRPFRLAGKYAREALRTGQRLGGRAFSSTKLVGKPKKRAYHRSDCDTLEPKNAAIWVAFADRKTATQAGRAPCLLCLVP